LLKAKTNRIVIFEEFIFRRKTNPVFDKYCRSDLSFGEPKREKVRLFLNLALKLSRCAREPRFTNEKSEILKLEQRHFGVERLLVARFVMKLAQ
jgi:hypothetical protein